MDRQPLLVAEVPPLHALQLVVEKILQYRIHPAGIKKAEPSRFGFRVLGAGN